MPFRAEHISVGSGTTPTLLTPGTDVGGNGRSVWITIGDNDVWIWGANETIATDGTKGSLEKAGSEIPLDLEPGDVIYGRAATGTSVCKVRQTGVSLT